MSKRGLVMTIKTFNKITNNTLKIIDKMSKNKEPSFILPTKYISRQSAQLGYLLDKISNDFRIDSQENNKSFFCNSADEALQGTIKIMRHYGYKKFNIHQGNIILYKSQKELYKQLEISDFYPNITSITSLKNVEETLKTNVLAVIFVANTLTELEKIGNFLQDKKLDKKLLIGLDLSQLKVSDFSKIKTKLAKIDAVLFGEELTNREIPFGAFCMSNELYSPWNNIANCLTHSSTYSGNILALNKALDCVLKSYKKINKYKSTIKKISDNYEECKKYFANYVNPKLIKLYKIIGYDFDVIKAKGSYLTVKRGEEKFEVFDCVGGGGLSIFGHNPDDIKDVIKNYDGKVDYAKKLNSTIKKISDYDHAFLAVSGASAVETAIITALSAQDKKKQKILIFSNNYSGKLLLPLIGTQISQKSLATNHYFKPIYDNIVVINPFDKKAVNEVEAILKQNDVGLIWFEYIRGMDGKQIPSQIIDVIKENKKKSGYYVGVDEILCGMHRTGPFMSIDNTKLKPDITTLSKGLSYMLFPIGATLFKSDIYDKAIKNNKSIIEYLKTRYVNQFGAYIACHCLNRIKKEGLHDNVVARSQQLAQGITRNSSDKIATINQYGLYFNMFLKKPWWVKYGFMSEVLETLWLLNVVKKWLVKGKIFMFFDTRLLPNLSMSEKECSDLISRINKSLAIK